MSTGGQGFSPKFELNAKGVRVVKSDKLVDALAQYAAGSISSAILLVPELPSSLYKYKSVDLGSSVSKSYAEDSLVDELIYCSDPDSLNDINDIRVNFEKSKSRPASVKAFIKVIEDNPLGKLSPAEKLILANRLTSIRINDQLRDMLEAELRSSTSVFCVTADSLSELMWAHYADSHKGFCIEYQTGADDSMRLLMRKVEYTEKFPIATYPVSEDHDYFLKKSNIWSYEQEYRMVLPCSSISVQLKPNTIQSITVGVRAKKELIDFLMDINKKRKHIGKKAIPINKAIMFNDKYGLGSKRLPL